MAPPWSRSCWAAALLLLTALVAPTASQMTTTSAGTSQQDVEALQAIKGAAQSPEALETWDFTVDPCGRANCSLQFNRKAYRWHNWATPQSAVLPGTTVGNATTAGGEGMLPCNFHGLACEKGRVTELVLPDAGLGLRELPRALSQLSALRGLDLSGNGIFGSLPAFLPDSLTNLESLSLAANNLTGELSHDVLKLHSLQLLDLSDNSLEGGIEVLSMLHRIEVLDLHGNNFRGSVPIVMTSVRDTLVALDISYNCRLCGGLATGALYEGLEVFKHAGTHVWTLCTYSLEGYCPPDSTTASRGSFALGLQMVVVVIFILLGSLTTCTICTCLRHPSLLSELFMAARSSPQNHAALDEAALTHAALEELASRTHRASASQAGSTSAGGLPTASADLYKSRSIGAVIINPGSTLQCPNICVAVMELDSTPQQRAASMAEQQLESFRTPVGEEPGPARGGSQLRTVQSLPSPLQLQPGSEGPLPPGAPPSGAEQLRRQGSLLRPLSRFAASFSNYRGGGGRSGSSGEASPEPAATVGHAAAGETGQASPLPPPAAAAPERWGGVEMVVRPVNSSSSLWARASAQWSRSMQRASEGRDHSPARQGSPQYPMSPAGSGEMPMVFV